MRQKSVLVLLFLSLVGYLFFASYKNKEILAARRENKPKNPIENIRSAQPYPDISLSDPVRVVSTRLFQYREQWDCRAYGTKYLHTGVDFLPIAGESLDILAAAPGTVE